MSEAVYLVAIEYTFDDGGKEEGHGDALFVTERGQLYVVECKVLSDEPRRAEQRLARVCSQARKYASRLSMWLRYLSDIDVGLASLQGICVVPAVLTEKMNRLQLHI
jgi:hypothetical protein